MAICLQKISIQRNVISLVAGQVYLHGILPVNYHALKDGASLGNEVNEVGEFYIMRFFQGIDDLNSVAVDAVKIFFAILFLKRLQIQNRWPVIKGRQPVLQVVLLFLRIADVAHNGLYLPALA